MNKPQQAKTKENEMTKQIDARNEKLADARALLKDADLALEDLGACNDEDCTEANCLKVRQRIKSFLRETNQGEAQ